MYYTSTGNKKSNILKKTLEYKIGHLEIFVLQCWGWDPGLPAQ